MVQVLIVYSLCAKSQKCENRWMRDGNRVRRGAGSGCWVLGKPFFPLSFHPLIRELGL
jgi:hypothetical protein